MAKALAEDPDLLTLDLDNQELDKKSIKRLALALGRHTSIQELDLSRNVVGDKCAENLATAIGKNKSLRTLTLRNVGIKEVGAGHLAKAIEVNATLKDLILSRNKVGDVGARQLAESMRRTSGTLNTLDLSSGGISLEGVEAVAEAIVAVGAASEASAGFRSQSDDKGLQALRLRDNTIGDEAIELLAEAIQAPGVNLKELDLCRSNAGESGVSCLAAAIQAGTKLQKLGLFGNPGIGVTGASKLGAALRYPQCSLRDLDLSKCDLGDEGVDVFATAALLRRSVPQPPKAAAKATEGNDDEDEDDLDVQSYHSDSEESEDEETRRERRRMEDAAREAPLGELHLCRNDFGERGARSLAIALKNNAALTVLNLRDNRIGDEGVVALSEALKKNMCLKDLDLGGNQVSDWGAREIGMALIMNPSLSVLILQANRIGDQGAAGLASGLERNGGLEELDLSKNQIGDVGCGRLLQAVEKNRGLCSLNLEDNEAEEACIDHVTEQVRLARASRRQEQQAAVEVDAESLRSADPGQGVSSGKTMGKRASSSGNISSQKDGSMSADVGDETRARAAEVRRRLRGSPSASGQDDRWADEMPPPATPQQSRGARAGSMELLSASDAFDRGVQATMQRHNSHQSMSATATSSRSESSRFQHLNRVRGSSSASQLPPVASGARASSPLQPSEVERSNSSQGSRARRVIRSGPLAE